MNYFLAQISVVVGSSDGEEGFWMQIMVFVVLGAIFGVYSLVKTRTDQFKGGGRDYAQYSGGGRGRGRGPMTAVKTLKNKWLGILDAVRGESIVGKAVSSFNKSDTADEKGGKEGVSRAKERDLDSGMEILELDFLLSVIEKTDGDDERDVIMRRLSFDELIRRVRLDATKSNVLKVYAIDEGDLYGKDIQCEAMQELVERTASASASEDVRYGR